MRLSPRQLIKNNKQKGFTLMEILVYMGLLSIIILAISSFVHWSIYSHTRAKAIREVSDNSREAMRLMIHEIQEAKSIYTPNTTSSQLSLETKKYLPEGEETAYIDFYVYIDEKKLCFKKESQDPVALTSDRLEVNNLVFTQIGTNPPSVQVELTLNYKNPQDRPEFRVSIDLTSTASLRSY